MKVFLGLLLVIFFVFVKTEQTEYHDYDQEFSSFHPETDVYNRDFKDEFEPTELKKIYKLKIIERDDFHLNSFSEVHVSIELVYPPEFLANATFSVVFSLFDKNLETSKPLNYFSNVNELKEIKIDPWRLQNFQNSLVVIEVENDSRENIIIEVKISKSRLFID